VTLTAQMTADDWQELNAIWRKRPPGWQCCLATLLASVAVQRERTREVRPRESGELGQAADAAGRASLRDRRWPKRLIWIDGGAARAVIACNGDR
jgi:hypothetical protein